jgi:hypothetical protein
MHGATNIVEGLGDEVGPKRPTGRPTNFKKKLKTSINMGWRFSMGAM